MEKTTSQKTTIIDAKLLQNINDYHHCSRVAILAEEEDFSSVVLNEDELEEECKELKKETLKTNVGCVEMKSDKEGVSSVEKNDFDVGGKEEMYTIPTVVCCQVHENHELKSN